MATSNLRCVLDAAFLDRVDYPLHIPLPGPRATYEILASCYNAMLEKGVIHFPPLCKEHYEVNCLACTDLLDRRFPNVSGAHVLFWRKSSAPQNILWRLAEECGLSGRNLRLLPYKAIASYTYVKPVSVHSALDALKRQIEEEKRMNVS